MKYLKKFNENIISAKNNSVDDFVNDLLSKNKSHYDLFTLQEVGSRHGIEFVDYETFYSELDDFNKKQPNQEYHSSH